MTLVQHYFPDNYTKFNTIDDTDEIDNTSIESIEFLKVKNDIHNLSIDSISFDYIQFSKPLVDILNNVYNVKLDRFVPEYMFNKIGGFDLTELSMSIIQTRMILIMDRMFLDTKKKVHKIFNTEFIEFMGKETEDKIGTSIFSNIYSGNNKKILIDRNMNIMIVTDYVNTFFMNNMAIMIPNNRKDTEFAIITNNRFYMCTGQYSANFKISSDKNNLYLDGMFIASSKTQELHIKYDYINDRVTTNYRLYNRITKLKVLLNYLLESNGDAVKYYNKNGLLVSVKYRKETDTTRLISYCMVENDKDSSLRFRGKYEEDRKGNKIVKKELSKNDKMIYQKENDEVKVDMIHNKKIKEIDIVIGWKVAKSPNGENRIIKLMIPMDARIVSPIDDEYFHTRGKERCDKAIVMDIQYPEKEEEKTVVPNEIVAYSYIHISNTPLEYKVGKEIYPDMFDTNEDTSCTHGIHFYRNRNSVFDVYVNR